MTIGKLSPLSLEKVSELLVRHVNHYLRATNTSAETYGLGVACLMQRMPEGMFGDREFPHSGGAEALRKKTGRKIRDWLNGDVSARPSIDVFPFLVLGMPRDYVQTFMLDYAIYFGGTFWQVPVGAEPSTHGVAELLRANGAALSALAPAFANNNKIDSDDPRQVLLNGRRELLGVAAVISGIIATIDSALNQQQAEAGEPKPYLRSVA